MMHRMTPSRRTWASTLVLALSVPAVAIGAQDATNAAPGSNAAAARATASASVLAGEHRAAPIVFSPAGLMARGRLVGAAGSFDTPTFAKTDQIQFQDRVYVVAPGGAALGTSYVVVDSVAVLPGGGIVMLPTGVVRVERTSGDQAATARVVQQFAPMRVGQFLITMDDVPVSTPNPTPVTEPVSSTVVWRPGAPALPGVLQWLVLETESGANFAPGDQLALVRPSTGSSYGVTLPEEVLGQALVVRSGTHGVTALLLQIDHGAITEGTVARRSARGG